MSDDDELAKRRPAVPETRRSPMTTLLTTEYYEGLKRQLDEARGDAERMREALVTAARWFEDRAKQVGELDAPGSFGIRAALNGYAEKCWEVVGGTPAAPAPGAVLDREMIHGYRSDDIGRLIPLCPVSGLSVTVSTNPERIDCPDCRRALVSTGDK